MKNYGNKPDEIVEGKPLRRAFSGSVIKSIDKDKRQIEFIISTASVDRMRDVIEVNGWDLKNYKKNPVVLFGHSSHIPPIGKAIKTWKTDTELRSVAEFMPPDISAFAHSIFRMFEEKFLKAVSVGFKPLKYEEIKDENGDWTYGYRFLKQELLEFSAVPIPANPEALVAARSMGIDTMPFKAFAEELLDNWKVVGKEVTDLYHVDQKGMEAIRRRAAGLGATFKVPLDLQDAIRERNLAAIREAKAKKDNQMVLESVTIQGIEFDLPLATDVKDVGTVKITQNLVDEVKSYNIDKADDKVSFTGELLNTADFIKAELRDGEDGKQDLIISLKGENKVVEYDLVGVNERGDLVGMKLGETEVTKDDEGEVDEKAEDTTAEDVTEPEAEEKTVDEEEKEEDKSSDEDDEDEDEDEKASDDEDEDEDEKASDDEDEDDEDDDKSADDFELKSISDHLIGAETILCQFEEFYDKNASKATRHEQRKALFLASYLRELADKLDGGKTSEEPTKKAAVVEEEREDKGFTPEEATDYIKSFTSAIQPHLERIISEKVNKIRGRLD